MNSNIFIKIQTFISTQIISLSSMGRMVIQFLNPLLHWKLNFDPIFNLIDFFVSIKTWKIEKLNQFFNFYFKIKILTEEIWNGFQISIWIWKLNQWKCEPIFQFHLEITFVILKNAPIFDFKRKMIEYWIFFPFLIYEVQVQICIYQLNSVSYISATTYYIKR